MQTWLYRIERALSVLGGRAALSAIYGEVERDGFGGLTKRWRATVRNTIERHSSDSANWNPNQPDVFYSVDGLGSGTWGLRRAMLVMTLDDL